MLVFRTVERKSILKNLAVGSISTWKFVLDFKAIDRMKTWKVWSRCFVLLLFWNYYFDPVWSVIGFVLLLVSHFREQYQSCIYRKLWLTASSRTPTELLWKGKLEVVLTNLLKKRYFSLTWRKTLFRLFFLLHTVSIHTLMRLLDWMALESQIFLMRFVLYWELPT